MKLYQVSIIVGPGPKWDWKFITAESADEAIKKAQRMGYDARNARELV